MINRTPLPSTQANGIAPEVATTDKESNLEEWGEFLHVPGQKFYDFNKIREEIVKETESKTGKNAGISPAPINLRIYSPNVLTLTLVDLPGLTKVPVGDQPRDIERQIRDMVLKQISKPNAIILAVTAANTDLANSDGLKLAREVDPEGQRTIGVLTKVDLMDEGTDVVDILAGRIIPLRLGYVPVVNRGQRDIENKKPIQSALEGEKNFFENHKAYRNKASYCGTPYLARKLNLILMMHIKQTLPDIKARISSSLQKYTAELNQLGDSILGNSSNIILNIITEFCNEYRTVLDGNNQELSSLELSGGARISFVFHELYSNGVKAVDPFDMVKDIDIRTILYNSSGSAPALFVGTTAFELIVKQQIRRLEEPSLKCVSLVYDELVRILGQLLNKPMFRRYPALKEKLHAVVVGFFKKVMDPTNKLVRDLVSMESCYVNTGHPDFLNGHRAMAIVNERHMAARPVQVDPKSGKPLPASAVPARPASPASLSENGDGSGGFFGSFFASKNKKKLAAMEAPPPTLKASGTLSEKESQEVEVISECPSHQLPSSHRVGTLTTPSELLINSYFGIVRRTMIDMVPKAIMLTLVQSVDLTPQVFPHWALTTHTDTQKTKCSASSSSKCTAPTSSTTCSRRASTRRGGGKSACRWWRAWARRRRLSGRCSRWLVSLRRWRWRWKGKHLHAAPLGERRAGVRTPLRRICHACIRRGLVCDMLARGVSCGLRFRRLRGKTRRHRWVGKGGVEVGAPR